MTLPSTVEVLQWRCGMQTPTITQPTKPSTTATTSTIGSMMTPPQLRRPQKTLSRVSKMNSVDPVVKTRAPGSGSAAGACKCVRWDMSGSADMHNHLYDSSLSLLPFHLTNFFSPSNFYTPETEQVFIDSCSGPMVTRLGWSCHGISCLLDVLAHVSFFFVWFRTVTCN